MLLRGAMAAETPLHLQAFLLVHQRHLIDRTMARVATDALGHMNAVVEIDEVGKLVDAGPLQRLAAAIAGSDGLEELRVGPDLRVAIHAGLGRRNAGKARGLDRGVAVTAVDAESGHVVLMAEGHRLRLAHSGIRYVRRALNLIGHAAQCRNDEYRAEDGGARKSIRTAMKDLRHSLFRSGERDPADRPLLGATVYVREENHPLVF